jgi:hypothetical protein
MASNGPVFGEELRSGLRGANDGVPRYADLGPVEHQVSLTSELTIALDLNLEVEYRVVGRLYFRLRLSDARSQHLHFARKR